MNRTVIKGFQCPELEVVVSEQFFSYIMERTYDDVCFEQDQTAKLDFYSARSLK